MTTLNRLVFPLLLALLLALAGCTTAQNYRGTATGAVLGGAAGAAMGNAVDDEGDEGMIIGGAAGALIGGAAGAHADRERRRREAGYYDPNAARPAYPDPVYPGNNEVFPDPNYPAGTYPQGYPDNRYLGGPYR